MKNQPMITSAHRVDNCTHQWCRELMNLNCQIYSTDCSIRLSSHLAPEHWCLCTYTVLYEDMTDHRSYTHNLSSCEIEAGKKKTRPERDSSPWPLRYRIRIPFRPEFFFRVLFHNCLSCLYKCVDQSCLHIFLRSSNIWSFVYSFAHSITVFRHWVLLVPKCRLQYCPSTRPCLYNGAPLNGQLLNTDTCL